MLALIPAISAWYSVTKLACVDTTFDTSALVSTKSFLTPLISLLRDSVAVANSSLVAKAFKDWCSVR